MCDGCVNVIEDLVFALNGHATELAIILAQLFLVLCQGKFITYTFLCRHGVTAFSIVICLVDIVDVGNCDVYMVVAASGNDSIIEDCTIINKCILLKHHPFLESRNDDVLVFVN